MKSFFIFSSLIFGLILSARYFREMDFYRFFSQDAVNLLAHVASGNLDGVRQIVERNGAPATELDKTALASAANHNKFEVILYLLSARK